MLVTTLTMLAVLLVLAALLVGVFMLGMREKWPFVINTQRRINRRVFNPRQMRSAGASGASASVVRHVGRSSGSTYETPVGVAVTDDGFAIGLPYGLSPDWLKNVLAAGSATIVHDGREYEVDRPEVVPIETMAEHFRPSEMRSFRAFRVDQCLRVRIRSGTP